LGIATRFPIESIFKSFLLTLRELINAELINAEFIIAEFIIAEFIIANLPQKRKN